MSGFYFPLTSYRVRVSVFAPASALLMAVSEGVAAAFCILCGTLVHELGHLFFIRLFSQSITSLTVEPFGAEMRYTSKNLSYAEEKLILFGGMAFNSAFSFVSATVFYFFPNEYVLLFMFSCLFFAFINIVPFKSNDGGRIIYLILCESHGMESADKAMKIISSIAFFSLLAVAIYILVISDFNNGLCVAFLLCGTLLLRKP